MVHARRIAALIFACLAVVYVLLQPTISVTKTVKMLDYPGNQEAIRLLNRDGTLKDFQDQVLAFGQHVDGQLLPEHSRTLLSEAVKAQRQDIVLWLLAQGANPNGTNISNIPLVFAIRNLDSEMTMLLLDHGADPDCRRVDGKTLVELAVEVGFDEVAEIVRSYPRTKVAVKPSPASEPAGR